MAQPKLVPLDHPEIAPFRMSPRLRSQLVYFMAGPDAPGKPELGENEYWFNRDEVTRWVMEGVFYLVSPLDTQNMTEVELTEEQDALLNWLETHRIQHVRVVE
jgi:hypothetical protein